MKTPRTIIAAFFVVLAVSPALAQTGGINVKILDPAGAPLPGATVIISHPAGYIKTSAMHSDRDGRVSFPILRATGTTGVGYTIQISMPGFASIQLTDLSVRMGRTTELPIKILESEEERVEVIRRTDVVYLDDTSQTVSFTNEFIQDLPVPGRFYQNVLSLAPGAQDIDGDGNPAVHGSRDRDFKSEVSGISNVDPLTGLRMSQVNPDSIEEMQVITAGAGVEFSRAQGGFARVLQKQGSNEFDGVAELYYRTSALDGDGAGNPNNVDDTDFDWVQPAFQLSGPIVKDKLWYRLSHQWIRRDLPTNTTRGISIVTDNQAIHSDQITWQVSPRNKLALQYQADPRQIDNFGVSSTRPEEAALLIDTRSETLALAWTVPFSPRILIDTRVAWQDLDVSVSPAQRDVPNDCIIGPGFTEEAQCFNLQTGELSGSYPQDWNDQRQRLTVRGDATIYGGRFAGVDHQLKFGVIVENERYARELERRPAVDFLLIEDSSDLEWWSRTWGLALGKFSVPELSDATSRGVTWGFYGEDRIRVRQNLTVSLGIRIDREEIRSTGWSSFDPQAERANYLDALGPRTSAGSAAQQSFTNYESRAEFLDALASTLAPFEADWNWIAPSQEIDIWTLTRHAENIDISNTNLAPRISLAWDPWSDGKTKFAGTWGRYYDAISLDIPLMELEPASTDLAFDADATGSGWRVEELRAQASPAINVRVVDNDLETPYQDEWTLQVERQVAAETSLRLSYINRDYRDQLQDTELNHSPADLGRCTRSTLANPVVTVVPMTPGDPGYSADVAPGDGLLDDCIGKSTVLYGLLGFTTLHRPDGSPDSYLQNPFWGDVYLIANLNRIEYEAFVLELVRRQYRNWEMQASYTWSTAQGEAEDFTRSVGDDRSVIQDEAGYQAYDQRHVVKVSATTIVPWGFRIGGIFRWQSGLPYSILQRELGDDAIPADYGTLAESANPQRVRTTYPTGQRNDQRNAPYWNFDIRIAKEFRVGRSQNLQASVEIFNLFNDGTYQVYDPVSQVGEQINGTQTALRRFGRQWQLGIKFAF